MKIIKLLSAAEMTQRVAYIANLSEVGSVTLTRLRAIQDATKRIAELRTEAHRLEQEVIDAAASLENEVENLWTAEEIARAKEIPKS